MPKVPRNDQEINEFKDRILDVTAAIIREDGFNNLSMRKIGACMNMAAASLYYYFTSKDEIYLAIRMRAGNILHEKLSVAYASSSDLQTKALNMIRAYVEFGLHQSHYYEVMFNSTAPKYSDYKGTALEKAAADERESSLLSLAVLSQCVGDFASAGYDVPEDIKTVQLTLWSQLHGIVSMHNNNLLKNVGYSQEEMGCSLEETVNKVADLFFVMIMSFIEKTL